MTFLTTKREWSVSNDHSVCFKHNSSLAFLEYALFYSVLPSLNIMRSIMGVALPTGYYLYQFIHHHPPSMTWQRGTLLTLQPPCPWGTKPPSQVCIRVKIKLRLRKERKKGTSLSFKSMIKALQHSRELAGTL